MTDLTIKEIMFGKAGRRCPDETDMMILREYAKAKETGLTWLEVCERMLGRKLTKAEVSAVDLYEEIGDNDWSRHDLALLELILDGLIVDSGERRDDRIVWVKAPGRAN